MMSRGHMLEKEKIGRLMMKLAVPATVSMLVNALYNLVDTIFIGRGIGYLAIGGLTIVFPVQTLIMAASLMIGVGGSSVISRSLGAKDFERAQRVAGNSFVAISALGVFVCVLGLIFINPLLRIFGATAELFPYAKEYLQVILVGSLYFPFVISSNNIIRAEGKARVAMVSMLIGAVGNVILDYIFIFPFQMGVFGAALATILSQLASAIFVFLYFKRGHSTLQVQLRHLKPEREILREITTVGFASFARNSAGSLIIIIVNNLLGVYGGNMAISIYGIIQRFTKVLFLPLFGIVQGMQPIVGYNYGAKNLSRVKRTVRLSIISSMLFAVTSSGLAQLFPDQLIRLFSTEAVLIKEGVYALRLVILMVPIVAVQIVGAAFFQAIGKVIPAIILTLSREILLFIPFVLILPRFFGLFGIWVSFPVADFFAALITTILLIREMRMMERELILG
ncbi:MAG TPA: MATE family efflux transporter [Firmicutes bacterium]|nr:MATE family efflux transporter [Bacillota bacterium]